MDLIADYDLTALNTLGLKSVARYGVVIEEAGIIEALVAESGARGLPFRIIGGGSNLVLPERLDAIVGLMRISGRARVPSSPTHTVVTAGAGENWHDFVAWTVGEGLPGLENLAGIPGTVGAAPVQNIGAYGIQLSDHFHELTAFDTETGETRSFDRVACGFSYRQSFFKAHPGRYVILSVSLALPHAWQANRAYPGLDSLPADADAKTVMDRVVALRASKLPDWEVLGNAGSFFHNPVVTVAIADAIEGAPRYPQADGTVKLSAGWLIEQCGLKGERLGPVGMYEGHALVLVNHGGAVAADVERFSALVRERVRERFGVELIQEPIAF
ncbi:UDP-N-acetylmuramate dehydrogenase [Martelella endophytica]|uniref:UDP-N-acetylenolpyruvoylglucosamine reductase n=1 Tax=Martelella endophytica TaxID=1486262 RepID=A0A0D5LLH5_MAREN|nr:UDP-N-acetylmuramate dehydrogenase [Martelella endophytica]AJY44617.1 hypothetical protein TM49_01255 [Martelella endophytica]